MTDESFTLYETVVIDRKGAKIIKPPALGFYKCEEQAKLAIAAHLATTWEEHFEVLVRPFV